MIQIRRNVFETNSSSVHSIVICTKKEYNDFKAGKTFYVSSRSVDKKFYTWEELLELLKSGRFLNCSSIYEEATKLHEQNQTEELEEYLRDWEIYTFDSYFDNEYESFFQDYEAPSGDQIKIFGYYGESY